mgnify:CR=1 FL=1
MGLIRRLFGGRSGRNLRFDGVPDTPRSEPLREQVTHFLIGERPWERVTIFEFRDPAHPEDGYKEPTPFKRQCRCPDMQVQGGGLARTH